MQRYKNFLNRARIFIKKMYATFSRKSCKVANCMQLFFEEREFYVNKIKYNIIIY